MPAKNVAPFKSLTTKAVKGKVTGPLVKEPFTSPKLFMRDLSNCLACCLFGFISSCNLSHSSKEITVQLAPLSQVTVTTRLLKKTANS